MKTPPPLTAYGLMAERHWREFRPGMVREMERHGTLHQALLEAQERTLDEMETITLRLETEEGMSVTEANDMAWEMVRERYILLPEEDPG